MALRFSPGTSSEAQARIRRALDKVSHQGPQQAELLARTGGAVEIGMSDTLPPHTQFQFDPIGATISINANVDMTDDQLGEGILTRLLSVSQFGLKTPVELVDHPLPSGSLSNVWNRLARDSTPVNLGAKKQVQHNAGP